MLRRKYLTPASLPASSERARYRATYVGMLISSSDRKSVTRSLAAAVKQEPATMVSTQAWYSAACSSDTSSQLNSTNTAPPMSETALIKIVKRSSQMGLAYRVERAAERLEK